MYLLISNVFAQSWVNKTLRSMTLDQKIGQLFMVPFEGDFLSENDQNYKDVTWSINRYKVGGLILFGGTPYSVAYQLNEFQKKSKIPLLVSSDFERGIFQQLPDGIHFPPNMALGATRNTDFAYEQGEIVAREARAIGVHMLLAPVLDVNNNPKNPIINFRSYGEDPHLVSEMGSAFIRGVQKHKVLATAKHFPGHGDTDFDSHLGLPILELDSARLDSVEFVPFVSAIKNDVGAIMTGHIALPKIHNGKNTPATTSKILVKETLRKRLKFNGLVISDAYNMKGINPNGMSRSAIVDAVNAGVDIILMPINIHFAFTAVKEAVRKKKISMKTLNAAVKRQLRVKHKLGLARDRYTSLKKLKTRLERIPARKAAYTHASESITWLRKTDFPQRIPRKAKLTVLAVSSESSLENPGKSFFNQLRRFYPNAERIIIDHRTDTASLGRFADQLNTSDVVITALFSRTRGGNHGHGIALREENMVHSLLEKLTIPIAIASFGSPYIATDFARYPNHLTAYSYSGLMQRAAAHRLAKPSTIAGTAPVQIPFINDSTNTDLQFIPLRGSEVPLAFSTEKLDSFITQAITDSVFPSASVVVGTSERILYSNAFGRQTYSAESPRVYSHTMYDVASLTKVMATSLAVMKLVGRNQLSLEATLGDILPEYADGPKGEIQIKHLLTHSAGLLWHKNYFEEIKSKNDMLAAVLAEPLVSKIGEKTKYSDLGFIILMQVVERITGQNFDDYMANSFYAPMGLKKTMFNPTEKAGIPPTEAVQWRGHLAKGEVHDENAMAMGGVSGHAGLFSSAPDLAALCQMLLRGGEYDGSYYLRKSVIDNFTRRANVDPKSLRAFGFDKPSPRSMAGKYFSDESYGHSGFTGTTIWIDPTQDVFIVLLTNRVYPTRENKKIRKFRPAFHNLAMETFGFTALRRSYRSSLKAKK